MVRPDGRPCAYFYLDPYARAAEKRGGAWMNEVAARSTALAPGGAAVRLPVAHMVCNQSPPVSNPDGSVTPSLMTFRECETLFHECGHALQHMLTQVGVRLFTAATHARPLHIHGCCTASCHVAVTRLLPNVLPQVGEGNVSGIRGVEWDAVEQPSQFMDYWAYDEVTLRGMARHWQTGVPSHCPEEAECVCEAVLIRSSYCGS